MKDYRKAMLAFVIGIVLLAGCAADPSPFSYKDAQYIPTDMALEYLNDVSVHCKFRKSSVEKVSYDDVKFLSSWSYGDHFMQIVTKNAPVMHAFNPGFICNIGHMDDDEEFNKVASALLSLGIECGSCEKSGKQ